MGLKIKKCESPDAARFSGRRARGVNDRSTDFLRGYAGPIALALTAALEAFMFRWTTQRSPADSSSLRRSRRAGHDRIGLMHDIAQRTIAVLGNDANASRLTRALPQRIATRVWSQKQLTLNQRVQGSSPCAPTKHINDLAADR